MNRKRKVFRIALIVSLCISLGITIFALGMYGWGADTHDETEMYKTLFMFTGPTFLLTVVIVILTTKKTSPEEILRRAPGKCDIQRKAYK